MSDPLRTDAPDPIPEIAPEITPEITPDPVPSPLKKIGLDEKRLSQLANARLRASQVNREKAQQRLRDKVAQMDAPITPPQSEVVTPPHHEQPIVIVEQSESDEEQLEGPPGVVFVRRRRPKPKVPEKSSNELRMDALYSRMFEW